MYQPEDYAAEWRELTRLGVPADEIIRRSRPSRAWFFRHIRDLVDDAVCSSCREHFSPRQTRWLTRCGPLCGIRRYRQEPQ